MTLIQIIAGLLRLTSVAAGLFSFELSPDPAHKLYLFAIPLLLVLVAAFYGLARLLATRDLAQTIRPVRDRLARLNPGIRRFL